MSRPATDSAAWELLDRLRPMPQPLSAHVVPLAVMVYLRWADFQEAEAEAMAAFDETDHTPLLSASLHWRCWHQLPTVELPEFFSRKLTSELALLGGSHDPLAAALFRLVPALRFMAEISPAGLAALTGWLAAQPFETPYDRRVLLEQFDAVLDAAASREAGALRTPAAINDLLVALAHPASGERLYDPCFGFGGILTAACKRVRQKEKADFTRNGAPDVLITGMDIHLNAYAVALARLALMGVAAPQLEIGNSLEREAVGSPRKQGFDLVVTNPPWGQRIESHGLDHFPIPSTDSTALFVQHALSQLRPEGRAVVVVPQGFLFQQGKPAALRQWLLERHRVDAVISLPDGAFLPHTSIKAAVLVLRRDGGPTRKVRMVDGPTFFEPRKGKSAGLITPQRIDELAAAVLEPRPGKAAWDIEADMIADLGFDLSPTRREFTEFEQIIESLGKEIPIHSLQQLCELSAGRAVSSAGLSGKPIGENPIPYVRIGDIQRGQTTKSSSWLTPESASDLGPRHRLRAGDVLVSKSGTIGKTGVVRNGAVGGIASGGFFVLRPDNSRIDPHFLAAYLQSNDCQQWLKSRSSGSVISGLQKQFIETLPVPLPPLQIQHRVASDFREQQVDALTQLRLVLSRPDSDPVAVWLDRSFSFIPRTLSIDPADSLKALRTIFGKSFSPVLDWSVKADDPTPLATWILNLSNVADLFRNLRDEVRGSPLLNLLQQALRHLEFAREHLDLHNPLEFRASELTRECIAIVEKNIDGLLEEVAVSIVPKIDRLRAGSSAEIIFEVTNDSPLPLWNLVMKCDAWRLKSVPVYLPEADMRLMAVEVQVPDATGQAMMLLEWSATTMEGRQESGVFEFAFNIEEHSLEAAHEDLGRSPYFHGPPVGPDRNDVFFGRDLLISRIKAQIQSGNTVLLEGNRRSGKSSILKHLEGKDVIPGWLAVFADFQGAEGDKKTVGMPNEAIWRALARSLASALARLKIPIPLPDGNVLPPGTRLGIAEGCRNGISTEAPWEDFSEYFQVILDLLREMDLGLVLMIDEFDKLQEGIDNGVTSPQIPENIRYLIQSHPRFVAILTGSRRMQRLRHEYWSALYGLGNRVGVTALDPESARKLVTEPVKGKVTYTEEAANMIADLTARQPFLIQYLCNRIFELVSHLGIRAVGKKLVEEAADSFVRDNEHFASLWDYAETDRRRFLIDICHRQTAGPDAVTFGLLQQQLATEGIEISDADLDGDLKFLQELEIIDFAGADGGGIYRLTVPLMGQWIDQQQEYAALRDKARKELENTR